MDSQKYLESYGWKKGEALRKGGLKKPILVSHKFDVKGIGHGNKESVAWWETVFDGQLKTLDVNSKGEFLTDQVKAQLLEEEERKPNSPLYQMFVKGEVLIGTKTIVDKTQKRNAEEIDLESEQLTFFYSSDEDTRPKKKRKAKKGKKEKKEKKEKKDKKAKKEKKEKKIKEDENKKKKKSKSKTKVKAETVK